MANKQKNAFKISIHNYVEYIIVPRLKRTFHKPLSVK